MIRESAVSTEEASALTRGSPTSGANTDNGRGRLVYPSTAAPAPAVPLTERGTLRCCDSVTKPTHQTRAPPHRGK